MLGDTRYNAIALLLAALSGSNVDAFASSRQHQHHCSLAPTTATVLAAAAAAEGFGAVKEPPTQKKVETNSNENQVVSIADMSPEDAKSALIELIPRMTGSDEENRSVESYVNLLEDKYSSIQTIDFLNLAMSGDWQLLFSTNLMGRPNRKLRLTELVQKIEADGFNGTLTNLATWDYAEDEAAFDASGNFNIKCSYSINQGARMVIDLDDHELRLAKGSNVPSDVPEVVGLLNRAIPKEMFDPNNHAMDTTYLDADLRIVRLTGPVHEGVRNIFMRKDTLKIQPMM